MIKIALLTILFLNTLCSSYAQDAKMKPSPAYDNINAERAFKEKIAPIHFQKYALLEFNNKPTSFKTDFYNINNHTVTTYPNQNNIKKVFFTKINRK